MKIAIIYKSLTGNTKLVAEAMYEALKAEHDVYVGEPADGIEADLYLVGSWTDKGSCAKEITAFLEKLEGKQIAIFGTAGFGGSAEYYNTLFERVKAQVPSSNQILGQYFCQGKMPMSVRDRYVAMMQANPEDKNLEVSIKNFDEAFSHPDEADLKAATAWAHSLVQ
ncbi:MAG: flavodoxin family protein [Roseburia sp.]|nr:flavodoxin family protein [Roseburia sp.]